LEQSQTEKEKILVLKSMGNSGCKQLLVPIKSIIEDKSQPLVVRTQAVFALRKISKAFEKLVRVTFTPCEATVMIMYTVFRIVMIFFQQLL